jgi:hypothetical protein
MANWQLIEHTSRTLVRVIKQHVDTHWTISPVDVRIATPHAFSSLKTVEQPTISLFLYRVIENAEQRNAPPRRLPTGEVRRQPMVLELCYLITPWGSRGATPADTDRDATAEEQQLLGLILQALYDRPELARAELHDPGGDVWGATDSLQVVCESLPLEETARLFDASELPYQLSATYRVRVLALDAVRSRAVSPVLDADFTVERSGNRPPR